MICSEQSRHTQVKGDSLAFTHYNHYLLLFTSFLWKYPPIPPTMMTVDFLHNFNFGQWLFFLYCWAFSHQNVLTTCMFKYSDFKHDENIECSFECVTVTSMVS